jgi:hypothetical protein
VAYLARFPRTKRRSEPPLAGGRLARHATEPSPGRSARRSAEVPRVCRETRGECHTLGTSRSAKITQILIRPKPRTRAPRRGYHTFGTIEADRTAFSLADSEVLEPFQLLCTFGRVTLVVPIDPAATIAPSTSARRQVEGAGVDKKRIQAVGETCSANTPSNRG